MKDKNLELDREKIFCIDLPFAIFPKARPCQVTKGGRSWWYTPSSKDEENLAEEVDLQMRQKGLKSFAAEDRLAIKCFFYFKGIARQDLDNAIKSLEDSIEKIAYPNDKQIKRIDEAELIENFGKDRILFYLRKWSNQGSTIPP